MSKRRTFLLIICFAVPCISAAPARAELYSFAAISDNSGVSGSMATQLSLEVTDYGTTPEGVNQALFAFRNNIAPYSIGSPEEGIITTVFFEDGALLGLAEILDVDNYPTLYPGVDFKTQANPVSKAFAEGATLDPAFQTTAHFWATKDSGATNGVNPGEKVGIVFDLEGGKTFADVITAIGLGFTNPNPGGDTSLRVGIHVQNLGEGGDFSDGFILTPVPGAVILGMLGLGVAGWKLRKSP